MTTNTLITEQPDALDLEDELLDFTANLLSLKANQPVLVALFSQPSGQWANVSTIVQNGEMRDLLTALETADGGRLQVTWLNRPETSGAYCLVLFFMESLG